MDGCAEGADNLEVDSPMERVLARLPRARQAAADLTYWRSRSVAERLAAVEVLRREAEPEPGRHDAEPRLQRICRVTRREGR
jgi:hypothetical protein